MSLETQLNKFENNLSSMELKEDLVDEIYKAMGLFFDNPRLFWLQKDGFYEVKNGKRSELFKFEDFNFAKVISEKKRYFFGELPEDSSEKKLFSQSYKKTFISPIMISDKTIALFAGGQDEEEFIYRDISPFLTAIAQHFKRITLIRINSRKFELRFDEPEIISRQAADA